MKTAPPRARGAALLAAMLTVTLVATFAAAALWQQWRAAQVEAAERDRMQSSWILVGALDWARLILREDANTGGADHLSEPWAVPLEDARLSTFLAADKNNTATDAGEGLPDAFLSGYIIDAQSKLNATNLINANAPDAPARRAFTKLFQILGLPPSEVEVLVNGMRQAGASVPASGSASSSATSSDASSASATTNANAPLMPQQLRQIGWFGLSPTTIAALEPYVTILPQATPLNVNTASAEALAASVPSLDLASAQRLVTQRMLRPFSTLSDANNLIAESNAQFSDGQHGVSSSFFEVRGRLRLDKNWSEERSLLWRNGRNIQIVWRERGAGMAAPADKP